jgi:autophagy-related protein 13
MSARDAGGGLGSPTTTEGPTSDSVKKLDQIVQNFNVKCAALVLHSRMNLPPVFNIRGSGNKKISKWFSIETDEFDDFREELRTWRLCGSFENRPPPMIIETYLDASRLTNSQSLVIVDENGKRWDVLEALNASDSSSDGSSGEGLAGRLRHVRPGCWRRSWLAHHD